MHKVVLVGPLPPPIHGEAAMMGLVAKKLGIRDIINLNHSNLTYGRPSPIGFIVRSVKDIFGLLHFVCILWRVDTVYISLKRSFFGSIKDTLYIGIALLLRKRVVGHIHGGAYATFYKGLPGWYQKIIFFLLYRLQTIIVLSNYSLQGLRGIGLHKKAVIIPNTLPVVPPKPQKKAHQSVRIVYLSHLVPEKGIETYISLAKAYPQWQFDCYGTPEKSKTGQRILKKINEQKNMQYCGILTEKNKFAALSAYDILVFPSTLEEGQPLVLLEAFAAGLAVVANAVGGVVDIVPKQCGALIAHNKPSDYVYQLKRLTRTATSLQATQVAARQYFEKTFSEKAFLNNMRKVLE
jgi:glycosyltransferase involved in cell wall biosynthesis